LFTVWVCNVVDEFVVLDVCVTGANIGEVDSAYTDSSDMASMNAISTRFPGCFIRPSTPPDELGPMPSSPRHYVPND